MIDKFKEIYNSYINGQLSQMVEQIKAYGAQRFAIDFYKNHENVIEHDTQFIPSFYEEYSRILYTFNLLKNR